ncbi:hypothetical protein [Bacillus marinisedimentorum]|uniref:hypothetical protein n=1 Tax=Bacillus marinisedimentorum TaxID=1821260 RepID=UPI000B3189B8|nr:hypothetical protein [Bacillus marinisedimentorum]
MENIKELTNRQLLDVYRKLHGGKQTGSYKLKVRREILRRSLGAPSIPDSK